MPRCRAATAAAWAGCTRKQEVARARKAKARQEQSWPGLLLVGRTQATYPLMARAIATGGLLAQGEGELDCDEDRYRFAQPHPRAETPLLGGSDRLIVEAKVAVERPHDLHVAD